MKLVNTIVYAYLILFSATCLANTQLNQQKFAERQDVMQFIDRMVKKHQFDKATLIKYFQQTSSSAEVIKKISTPYEQSPWYKYKRIFVNQRRIKQGVAFWRQYKTELQHASQAFGIPAEIIVSIIGVETTYGNNTGNYPVLQALATLAFDYPPRAKFFLKELEEFLLLAREENLDPLTLKGSYAGAMGTPQFIASSYRRYAIDFSKNGKIDLVHNVPNAIGSVANYLKQHGWQPNTPIAHFSQVSGSQYKTLQLADKKNPTPAYTIENLIQHGIKPQNVTKVDYPAQAALLEFNTNKLQGKEYWLGRKNFYVITRYNRSSNYAMAVYQLSEKLRNSFTS